MQTPVSQTPLPQPSQGTLNWALGDYVMESVIRAGGRSTVYAARKRLGAASRTDARHVRVGGEAGISDARHPRAAMDAALDAGADASMDAGTAARAEAAVEAAVEAAGEASMETGAETGPAARGDDLRALKVVSIGTDPDARTIADAERRGAELQQEFARHYGLVPWVEAIGEARSCLYVAMELVPGEDLLDVLGHGALPQARALDIAIQLATFLEKTHRFAVPGRAPERIIHADLKPGNVRVRPDGQVCVLDFGIAKAMAERRIETTQKWGTRQYMSPEWLQTGTIDEQVDYWSLGVLLYEMLAGHRPFRRFERHDNQFEDAIRRRERPETLPSHVTPALQQVVGRLLAPEIAQRYAGAAEIRAALEACQPAGTRAATSATPATSPPVMGRDDIATERAAWPSRTDVPTERAPSRPGGAPSAPSLLTHVVSIDADVPTLRAPWDSPPTERRPAPDAASEAAAFGAGAARPFPPAIPASDSVSPGSVAAGAAPGAVAAALPRHVRWSPSRRLIVAALWMVFAVIMASEGIACIAAERLRSDAAVADERGLDAALTRRTQLAGWTFFDVALRLRADPVLEDRLLSLADIVIADYRQEQPTVGRVEWERARGWLSQAVSLDPADARLRGKLRYTEGHLQRLVGARRADGHQARAARQSYYTAIQKFREAAALDRASPDPYLGLAHTYVYGLGDVENAVAAVKAAEQRGYRETRRERAQIGDAYRSRGERLWRSARGLDGDQQRDAYERAQKDFERCVESFTPIVEFASAADQLRRCEARLAELDTHRTPWWRRLLDPHSDLNILPPAPLRPAGTKAPSGTPVPSTPR